MDTQTQIERLIDLAIIQRSELKKLVSELPQLREHLNAEIERVFEDAEPQLRTELEDWTTKQAKDQTAKLGGELEAKIAALSKSLEATTQTRYNAIMAERAQNIDLAKKAEDKLAEVAQAIPVQVKQIVTDELARFPRAGEIDQLRKEFAEPRGLNPRGRWRVGETYNKLDLVSYNGDSYVSNTNGNREKPSRSSEAWTLSAARGNGGAGGGVTSLTDLVAVPANGELLIGNGSAFVNNTITGGTGVTVTNGPGTITIDASGAQEILTATVTNAESFAITRGQVVYLFGATGNRASVKLANNATDAESSKTFGVVSEASIAAGANGLVTCVGTVDKLTLGSYTEGDVLYLGATPGSVTATKPYAPNHLVYVGIVERANNGNGELYVRIQNGFELDEIHDVQITTPPLAGSLLMRDATNSLWKANRLTGTANQVTVTNADTSVTLSLPTTVANVNSVTAATTQNLTLAGGSTGASLVLGQGASGGTTITNAGSSVFNVARSSDGNVGLSMRATGGGNGGIASGAAGGLYLDGGTVRFRNQSGATEWGQFATTGNLLIGTTTDGGQKLQVAGTAAFTDAITVTTSAGLAASFTNATDNNWSAKIIKSGGNELQLSGNITANSGPSIRAVTTGGAAYAPLTVDGSTFTAKISGTSALSISAAYAATFAGNATANTPTLSLAATATSTGISFLNTIPSAPAGERNWAILTNSSAYGDLVLKQSNAQGGNPITAGTAALSFDVNRAATFAGAVTVNGTGTSTFSGPVTIANTASTSSYQSGLRLQSSLGTAPNTVQSLEFYSSSLGAALGAVDALRESGSFAGSLRFWSTTGSGTLTENMRLTSSGNLLIGTTTDIAGSGGLKVAGTTAASSTTSGSLINAGGFGNAGKAFFGDQIQVNGGLVSINSVILPAVNYSSLEMNAGTGYLTSYNPVGSVYLPMVIRALSYNFNTGPVTISNTTPSTGAGSGALQVAGGIYSGAASVFGGAVTASSNVKMGSGTAVALGSQFVVMDGGSEARLQINSTDRPGIYLTAAGANVATLRGNTTTTELITSGGTPLSINNSSLAATFAGAVAINNTVAAAVAVASTHKVTMVIGGVTYYLLASNV